MIYIYIYIYIYLLLSKLYNNISLELCKSFDTQYTLIYLVNDITELIVYL